MPQVEHPPVTMMTADHRRPRPIGWPTAASSHPRTSAERFYFEVGRRRARQGVDLAELISALTLLRKEIWAFAREHQVLANPIDVYRVMELTRRIVLFFDKALFHATRGFISATDGTS